MSWLKSFWGSLFPSKPNEPATNFTPRSVQILSLARKEAERLRHNHVGTEHLLLGLIKLGTGIAFDVLLKMSVSLDDITRQLEQHVGEGTAQGIPYTTHAKKALAFAAKEASDLGHSYVGTEHILLGLLREGDGVAARVLKNFAVGVEITRQKVLQELDPNYSPPGGSI